MSQLSARWQNTRLLLRGWPSAVLLVALVANLTYSIQSAAWVPDSTPILVACLVGLGVGGLLVATRWPGWVSGLYSFLISLLWGVQALGKVIPPPGFLLSNPLLVSADAIRLKFFAFFLRAGGWVEALRGGGLVNDTGLFVLLFSVLGWNAAVWLAWWLLRRRQALPGLLPLTILLAVNIHLSQQGRHTLLFSLFLSVVLLARGSFISRQVGWQRRRVDYSEELGMDWGLSAALAGLVVVAAALLFSYVGTREGWQAIQDLVDRSRQEMADTATQLFSGVKPPPPQNPDSTPTGPAVAIPDMNDIGAPLPQGSEVILRVKISDPAPMPDVVRGAAPPLDIPRHYWRSQIYASYTGRGWSLAPPAEAPPPAVDPVPPGRYRLEQQYHILARPSGLLFSVNDVVQADSGVEMRAVGPDVSWLLSGGATIYQAVSFAANLTVEQMENAGTDYPAGLLATYTDLPPSLPVRVARLASEVAGDGSPYSRALRVQAYLRGNYQYDLGVRPPPSGRDVVDYFLFDSQAGFCSHFATSMAVMLRASGVPARVVAGYAMGGYDSQTGEYVVIASQSHAWVEAYFPGYGWVEFEPTPAYTPFTYPQGDRPAGVSSPLGELIPAPTPPGRLALWPWLTLLLLVAGLWGSYFYLRFNRTRQVPAQIQIESLDRRALWELGLAGLPSHPSQTPSECLSALEQPLENSPRLLDALRGLTRLYQQSTYSSHPVGLRDVQMSRWTWRQARGERIGLLVRRLVKSLRIG